MHSDQAQGFFSVPVDNMPGSHIFTDHIIKRFGSDPENTILVSADFGASKRTHNLAIKLGGLPKAIIEKDRPEANKSEILTITGNIPKDARVIIYEDMIDTGGTIINTAKTLKEMGAGDIFIYGTHGIFSNNAEERFGKETFSITVTDSIPRDADYYEKYKSWLTMISLDEYFADAIHQGIKIGGSISNIHHTRKKEKKHES